MIALLATAVSGVMFAIATYFGVRAWRRGYGYRELILLATVTSAGNAIFRAYTFAARVTDTELPLQPTTEVALVLQVGLAATLAGYLATTEQREVKRAAVELVIANARESE